jgi:DNA-binding beta-propeller fold protein YncE
MRGIDTSRYLHTYDPASGEHLGKVETGLIGRWTKGLAWDGQYIWAAYRGSWRLKVIDPVSGQTVSEFQILPEDGMHRGSPSDLTWLGDQLWVMVRYPQYLARIDPETGAILSKFLPIIGPYITGLTNDGTDLWLCDYTTDMVYEVNPGSGLVVSSFPAPGDISMGLEWDGHYLWVGNFNHFFKVDVEAHPVQELQELRAFNAPLWNPFGIDWHEGYLWHTDSWDDIVFEVHPDNPHSFLKRFEMPYYGAAAIVHDGTYLWNSDGQSNRIFKLSPDSGEILEVYGFPGSGPFGLDHDGVDLWAVSGYDDRILRLDVDSLRVIQAFETPGGSPMGIAWDGEALWNSDFTSDLLYRISPATGDVLEEYVIPTGTPFGVSYDSLSGTFWLVDHESRSIHEFALPSTRARIMGLSAEAHAASAELTWNVAVESTPVNRWIIERRSHADSAYAEIGCAGGSGDFLSYMDHTVAANTIYLYRVIAEYSDGGEDCFGPVSLAFHYQYGTYSPPLTPLIFQSRPNPFRQSTTIRYELPRPSHVSVKAYDVLGREVKRIFGGRQAAGPHAAVWDGTNNHGGRAAAGVYLISIDAGGHRETLTAVLLR